MLKKIIATSMTLILLTLSFTACESEKKKNDDESTNPTVIETVTDEQGEAVTDNSGEAVTEVYEEVPVVDDKGNVVKDENGETVTKKVPATKPPESSTTTTTQPPSTTKPVKPTVPPTTNPKPTNPPTTNPKPTQPPTTVKPTEPSTKPPTTTEKPTEKPTQPPIEPSEDLDYFVKYAISYGKSIGLTYRTDINKDTGSWDNPMTMRLPVKGDDIAYYERQVVSRLNRIKREGSSYFWLQTESRDGTTTLYNLYIGY